MAMESASTPTGKQQHSKYSSPSDAGLVLKNQQQRLSSELDEQTTPKASNAVAFKQHQTPKAAGGGGMVGGRPAAEISFTPYFRQQTANKIRKRYFLCACAYHNAHTACCT